MFHPFLDGDGSCDVVTYKPVCCLFSSFPTTTRDSSWWCRASAFLNLSSSSSIYRKVIHHMMAERGMTRNELFIYVYDDKMLPVVLDDLVPKKKLKRLINIILVVIQNHPH